MAFDLTLNANVVFVEGKYGQLLGGGASGALGTGITEPDIFTGLTNATLETWFKYGGGITSIRTMVGSSGNLSLSLSETGVARGTVIGEILLGTVPLNDGEWHHMAVVGELNGTSRLFVDGVIVASVTKTLTPFGSAALGVRYHPAISGRGFTGVVDEIALSSYSKYTENFTPGPVDNNQPNLVAVWHLDGNGINSAGLSDPEATALILSHGSLTATINSDSAPFTITANGTVPPDGWTITPTSDVGVTFTPTSAILTNDARTVSFVAKATTTGDKLITLTNNAGLNSSSFTITAVNPSITLTGTGGYVGSVRQLTVSSSIPLTSSVTVTLTDDDETTGVFSISEPFTLSPVNPTRYITYMRNKVGTSVITVTNDGGLENPSPLSLTFTSLPVPKTAYPTESVTGRRVVKVGSGEGEDFATPDELKEYMATHNLIEANEIVIAEFYKDFTLGSLVFNPPLAGQDTTHYWVLRPVPGYAEADVNPNGPFYFGVDGIKLTITGLVQANRGVSLENFRIDITGNGVLSIGGPSSTLQPIQICAAIRNRIKLNSTAPSVIGCGIYGTKVQVEDNLIIRETGVGKITVNSLSHASSIRRNTFVVFNNTTDPMLSTGTASVYVNDNVFIGCGATPYTGSSSHVINNYTDTPLTTAHTGLIAVTATPLVMNQYSDLTPTANSALVGNGSDGAKSIKDNRLKNRGLDPDVGAWQRIPAIDVPTGSVIGNPVLNGQKLIVPFSTTNTPTEVQALMTPNSIAPGNAVLNVGVVSLNGNSGSAVFTNLYPGKYDLTIYMANEGGGGYVVNVGTYTILEISGNPRAPNFATIPVTLPPGAPRNVVATAGLGSMAIAFDPPLNNGGGFIFQYIVTLSTGEVKKSGSSPIIFTNLSSNVARTATVQAENNGGVGEVSVISNSITPIENPVPGVVRNVAAFAGLNSISVTFDPPNTGGNDILRYTVYLSTGEELIVTQSPAVFNGLNAESRTATVKAENGTGFSEISAASEAVTPTVYTIPTITIDMVDNNGNPVANLNGLKWASFDEESPELFTSPTDQGANEEFDTTGKLVIPLANSTKVSGEKVWLVITNINPTTGESYLVFSGQVMVN